MTRILILLCIFLSLGFYGSSQELRKSDIGKLPKVTHYSRADFQGDPQFWAMTRDKEGVLYFGNNDGVLIYDGQRWQKILLPNNSSVRSLTTSPEGKVYAGGYNEIGTIEMDSLGGYRYHSLLGELELEREKLENLWQVHSFKNHVIYRAFNELVVIANGRATLVTSNGSFIQSGVVNNKFYVQEVGNGILEFDPDSLHLKRIFDPVDFAHHAITAFLPTEDEEQLLLVSKSGAIFKANPENGEVTLWREVFEEEQNDQIISAVKRNDRYLLGTLGSKIVVLTEEGRLLYDNPAFAKMHDSSILGLSLEDGNVWALLNNGLDFIEFNAPFSQLFDEASIYDILIDQQRLYLATNKGVFHSSLSSGRIEEHTLRFRKIPNLEGQAWSLQKAGGSILVGHDKGLFELEGGLAQKIGSTDGFWKVIPIDGEVPTFLAANYHGLYLLEKQGNQWSLQRKIKGFEESTRDILPADEPNTFWVCHGYKGVYKLRINDDYSRVYAVDHYTDQNGLSSPFNVNVTRWNEEIIFTSNTGIYQFNGSSDSFQPFAPLNRILDTAYNTRKIFKEGDRAWFVQDDQVGYFNTKEKDPEIHENLFLNLKGHLNRGMESIYPLEDGKVLIGATTGLFLYNTQNGDSEAPIHTKITKASLVQGTTEKTLPLRMGSDITLPNRMEVLRLEFSTPRMSPSAKVQYQYFLEGIDKDWSAWENTAHKEYTHLPSGDYVFRVRSRDLSGKIGQEASFVFGIPPVWYQTTFAYIGYGILLFVLIISITHLVRRKIEDEQRKAQRESQKTKKLLELEIEQLKLEQEKERIHRDKQLLEEDYLAKNKELANYTMMLVKKKDVFSETYENLQEFKKTLKTPTARKRLHEVLQKLNQHRIGEEYMNIFDVNFEEVHKNFFHKLKALNPKLSKRELRLCAFVKMDLTNKEIAPLLNISVRGVETARYRVRKKLQVQEGNFLTFLENLPEAEDAVEQTEITAGNILD